MRSAAFGSIRLHRSKATLSCWTPHGGLQIRGRGLSMVVMAVRRYSSSCLRHPEACRHRKTLEYKFLGDGTQEVECGHAEQHYDIDRW